MLSKLVLLVCYVLLSHVTFCQNNTLKKLGLKSITPNNCTPVKDQYISSTCWSFSSNSFLESEVLRTKKEKIDLSEMFVARYSYLRKIETYLKNKGSNYFTPGGQFHDVVWVLKNYGIVPEAVYNGRPGKEIKHNHEELDTIIKYYVADLLSNKVQTLSVTQHQYLDSVFDYYLGKLPTQFEYNGIIFTPKEFLASYLKINVDDFVEITSYNHHPYYSSFVLEDKYNWTGDKYYNVPIADFISITNTALKNNYTIGWDGDVDEPGFQFYDGIAFLPPIKNNLQIERQKTFADSSTDIDHMMHIVAITKDKQGKNWYYVKNSWGNYSNSLNGFLYMSADYFAIKTSAIIINKKALPQTIQIKLKL